MRFTVTCLGSDPLGLREKLDQFAYEQWLPAHVTREEAVVILMDQFKRTVAQTIEVSTIAPATGKEKQTR